VRPIDDPQLSPSPRLNKMMLPDISIAVPATESVKKFEKHIVKAYFMQFWTYL
jgi:hypothetical protein